MLCINCLWWCLDLLFLCYLLVVVELWYHSSLHQQPPPPAQSAGRAAVSVRPPVRVVVSALHTPGQQSVRNRQHIHHHTITTSHHIPHTYHHTSTQTNTNYSISKYIHVYWPVFLPVSSRISCDSILPCWMISSSIKPIWYWKLWGQPGEGREGECVTLSCSIPVSLPPRIQPDTHIWIDNNNHTR